MSYIMRLEVGEDPILTLDSAPARGVRVVLSGGELKIEAEDLASFRAAAESHLRLLEIERKIYELVELRGGNG